jgi:phosphoglycolate phosphatase-like HAD superfamily hydrolase
MKYPPRAAGRGRPVFGLDIDGTLGDYHTHFLRFATDYLGRYVGFGCDDPAGCKGCHSYSGGSLAAYMGVSKSTYRQVKLAYRRGGLKRSMPVYEGARALTYDLRKRGAVVVICTTRPYLQLENIEPDTREFLRRNGIQHDAIISGENKYLHLKAIYGKEDVVAVLDDLPEMIAQAQRAGLWAIYRSQPWNAGNHGVFAPDLEFALGVLNHRLNEWEAAR